MTLGAAALLGLIGSLHCVTMCGPLAVLAAGTQGSPAERLRRAVLYHSGRTSMYAVLGAVAGTVGHLSTLAGAGRVVTIAAGVSLVVGAVAPSLFRGRYEFSQVLMPAVARAASAARRVPSRYPTAGVLALGMANGLVPCGMLHSALLLSLTAASPVQSAGTMAVFGAATAPALVATALAAAIVPVLWRQRLVAISPVAVAGVGVLLLVRGLTTSCH
jgi:sulfite exporter TauE/SafE